MVQLDRRRNIVRNEAGVEEKFGVKPESMPDYLAVTGDTADGYPGIAGWGAKAASLALSKYGHLENIPKDWQGWDPSIGRARPLAESLFAAWDEALLYRTLAILRLDVPVFDSVDDLRWNGPRDNFEQSCERLRAKDLYRRVSAKVQSGAAAVPLG